MSGRVSGKVAFITGAATGQGRSHAIRLAQEGADIIGIDLCQAIDSVPYPLASSRDLAETVEQVESVGGRIIVAEADVRDFAALKRVVDDGVARFGRLDIVCANAGIASYGMMHELDERVWRDVIDINLTGVWLTAKVAIPHLKESGGGSIILTSSSAGLRAMENIGHYAASKHGLVGLMRTLALELAAHKIRVNSVHPCAVNTGMIQNDATHELFSPDLEPELRTPEVLADRFKQINLLDVPWIEPLDVSNAVLWLASDEARYVTGVTLPVDAGLTIK